MRKITDSHVIIHEIINKKAVNLPPGTAQRRARIPSKFQIGLFASYLLFPLPIPY